MPRTTPQGEGSPPPTRGTLAIPTAKTDNKGITPAYAGNTSLVTQPMQIRGEHVSSNSTNANTRGSPPPTRGTLSDMSAIASRWGSPPPTRGTHFFKSMKQWTNGITPAYAGNTYRLDKIYKYYGDHPRLRGEHY